MTKQPVRQPRRRALAADQVWLIESTNRQGQRERIQFLGRARDKPKGWRIVRYLGPSMGAEAGTA